MKRRFVAPAVIALTLTFPLGTPRAEAGPFSWVGNVVGSALETLGLGLPGVGLPLFGLGALIKGASATPTASLSLPGGTTPGGTTSGGAPTGANVQRDAQTAANQVRRLATQTGTTVEGELGSGMIGSGEGQPR